MALPDGARIVYAWRQPDGLVGAVSAAARLSDACCIRLSERSWLPKDAGSEDFVVDLALGASRVSPSIPVAAYHAVLGLRVGERVRLSLPPSTRSAAALFACALTNGGSPTFESDEPQEMTVELLSISDERCLGEGITLLRRWPISSTAFSPERFSHIVVQFHLLGLPDREDPKACIDSEAIALDATSCGEPTSVGDTAAPLIYERWLGQRQKCGQQLHSAERLEFLYDAEDDAVPIGVTEALVFLGVGGVGEVLLEQPGSNDKVLLLLQVLEVERSVGLMSATERVQAAQARKDAGTARLSSGQLRLARDLYDAAAACVATETADFESAPADVAQAAKQLRISCLLNLALACMRASDWKETVAASGRVLEIEPCNPKALYRRGTALLRLGETEAAVRDLTAASAAAPKDASINQELRAARAKLHGGCERNIDSSGKVLGAGFCKEKGVFSHDRPQTSPPDKDKLPEGEVPFDIEKVQYDKLRFKELMGVYRGYLDDKLKDCDEEETEPIKKTASKPLDVMGAFRDQLKVELQKGKTEADGDD